MLTLSISLHLKYCRSMEHFSQLQKQAFWYNYTLYNTYTIYVHGRYWDKNHYFANLDIIVRTRVVAFKVVDPHHFGGGDGSYRAGSPYFFYLPLPEQVDDYNMAGSAASCHSGARLRGQYTPTTNRQWCGSGSESGWIRIRIRLDPDPNLVGSGSESGWIRIQLGLWTRIQRYKITDKMKGKAKFHQQKSFSFAGNYIFQVWT